MTPDKNDVLYGTLGLMIIKTLEALGPLHGYRIARPDRADQRRPARDEPGNVVSGAAQARTGRVVSSRWGTSESGRRVRIYTLTSAGRKQLHREEAQWQRAASIVERFFNISGKLS